MKKNVLKFPAFTIMEVVIVMLVIALLFGFAYEAYNIVNGSYQGFLHKNENLSVAVRLDEWLRKDFSRAKIIRQAPDGSILLDNDSLHISYTFSPDFICRTQGSTDTIKAETSGVVVSFEGGPLEKDPSGQSARPIDELQLNIRCQQTGLPGHYRKTYSSSDLLTTDPHATD